MLKTKAQGEEGGQPSSSRTYITSDNPINGPIEDNERARMATAIFLSNIEVKYLDELDDTTTRNSWNAESMDNRPIRETVCRIG